MRNKRRLGPRCRHAWTKGAHGADCQCELLAAPSMAGAGPCQRYHMVSASSEDIGARPGPLGAIGDTFSGCDSDVGGSRATGRTSHDTDYEANPAARPARRNEEGHCAGGDITNAMSATGIHRTEPRRSDLDVVNDVMVIQPTSYDKTLPRGPSTLESIRGQRRWLPPPPPFVTDYATRPPAGSWNGTRYCTASDAMVASGWRSKEEERPL